MTSKNTPPPAKKTVPPAEKLAWQIDEFSELSGLGRTKIYELIKDGTLLTIKVGGRRLVPKASGEALLTQGAA